MNKVPFGQDADGRMRTAYEVPNGLDCGCECPACSTSLIAKQGKSLVWHFAHASENTGQVSGNACGETAIHKVAKDVLQSSVNKTLHVPRLQTWAIGSLRGDYKIKLVRCWPEFTLKKIGRRVDVLAKTRIVRDSWPDKGIAPVGRSGGPLIIEINVSNPKGQEYIDDIVKAGISAVEISLTMEDVFVEIHKNKGGWLSAMKRLVLGPRNANRRWLHFDSTLLGK